MFRSENFSQGIFQSKIFVLCLAKRSYKMNFIYYIPAGKLSLILFSVIVLFCH